MSISVYVPFVDSSVDAKIPDTKVFTGNPIIREYTESDPYPGPYEVTPTSTSQLLLTDGKHMNSNVIIQPIPNNYGLVTWNGNVLTVS